jgi:drug/metabolite transporter (DMT)-like permease
LTTPPTVAAALLSRRRALAVWFAATLLTSSAAIMTRYAHVPASSIGFWRVFGAACILSPWCLTAWRREGRPRLFTKGTTLVGLLLGLHFATWCWALQNTTIANAMLFVGLQPLMAPFLARPLLGERLNRGELVGCLLACLGMVWILGGQFRSGREHLAGSLVAFVSALLCAGYFVLTRKYRARRNALVFGVPVYATAAVVQAVAGFAVDGGIRVGDGPTQLALLGLILLPTVGGHTLAIYLLRHVKSQMMTLSVPTQFILATVAAMFLFKETPALSFSVGAALVMAGVVLGVARSGTAPPPVERTVNSEQ